MPADAHVIAESICASAILLAESCDTSGGFASSPFFSVTSKLQQIDVHRSAAQAQITLDFERTDPKFKDAALTIVPVALPNGITAEVKRNGNGTKETYDINLKLPKNLAEGQHTFRYFAYAEMAGQGRGLLSGDIRLNILPDEKPVGAAEEKPVNPLRSPLHHRCRRPHQHNPKRGAQGHANIGAFCEEP